MQTTPYDQAISKIRQAMGKPQKILLVDDERDIIEPLKLYFENNGCNVLTGEDGLTGLSLYENNDDIDLLIIDIRMPKLNGIEVVKKIREENKKLPIVILTAYPETEDLYQIINIGWTILIGKPFELSTIQNVFNSFFKEYSYATP